MITMWYNMVTSPVADDVCVYQVEDRGVVRMQQEL